MKAMFRLLTAALMLILPVFVHAQSAVVPPGSGSQADPYLISELGHLVWMGDTVGISDGKYYTLTADIDASSTAAWNDPGTDTTVLEGFKPIGTYVDWDYLTTFCGYFDGGGHAITGLVINRPSTEQVGLFGAILLSAQIWDLSVLDAKVQGDTFVGILVGYLCGDVVLGCVTSGEVQGISFVGGLVGFFDGDWIVRCSSSARVQSDYVAGGLLGHNSTSGVMDCYATGVVNGNKIVGGLLGASDMGFVRNCYTIGEVTGNSYAGGLLGASMSSEETNSYWDVQTSGQGTSRGGIGKTTAEMQQQATFEGWDFTNIWSIEEGAAYPSLRPRNAPFMLMVSTLGSGNVVIDPPSPDGTYASGTVLTLTALPEAGSMFASWYGAEPSDSPTVALVMGRHCNVTAYFRVIPPDPTLTIETHGPGSVALDPASADGKYAPGTLVTLTATPDAGARFVGWTGVEPSDSPTVTVLMDANKTLVARFEFLLFKLDLDIRGPGIVEVDPASPDGTYTAGTVVTLHAKPADGNHFIGWIYPDWSNVPLITLVMDVNRTVPCMFGPKIEINSLADLAKIGDDPAYPLDSVWYVLTADIDASSTATWNDPGTDTTVLEGFKPIGRSDMDPFVAVFDGGGHSITGLKINRPDDNYAGLFGFIERGGTVKNLAVINCTVTGDWSVGGLAGYSAGSLLNCYTIGNIMGYSCVGGLLGYNEGLVSACAANGLVQGEWLIGGLIGGMVGELVANSHAAGAVYCFSYGGGLIGWFESGGVSNCFASCRMTGTTVGGLVSPFSTMHGIDDSSYWDMDVSGISAAVGGISKTTAEMKQRATFEGWDFDDIWAINENESYPYLRSFAGGRVIARKVFYNNSYYDNNNAGIDTGTGAKTDSSAIDTGKAPLMLGEGVATFANWTGYHKGINGLIYDVLVGPGSPSPSPSDFAFTDLGKDGTGSTPVSPSAAEVVVLQTDPHIVRMVFTFADHSVKNTWLQVDIGMGFGLPAGETHFWGNAVGDVGIGNSAENILVSPSDELAIRSHPTTALTRSPVTDSYDINKDSLVNGADQLIARSNVTSAVNCVKIIEK